VDSTQPSTERRRSERVVESLPLIVRGIDLLGQPFEERTTTLSFNLHGGRYASKYHLPKNTWVTLELPQTAQRRNVRARVAWIQRPRSVRELFQIGVELESAANIWPVEFPPESWARVAAVLAGHGVAPMESSVPFAELSDATVLQNPATGKQMSDTKSESFGTPEGESAGPFVFTAAADSPLLRELRAQLEREAMQAVDSAAMQSRGRIEQAAREIDERRSALAEDSFRRWKEEFEQAASGAHSQFASQLAASHDELLSRMQKEFELNHARARDLLAELERQGQALRAENEAAQEAASRMAQSRLQIEVVEAAQEAVRGQKQPAEAPSEEFTSIDSAAATWRQRLESEMALAQRQWNELLQSSLDSGMQRLVSQLADRSDSVLHVAEQKINDRLAELRQSVEHVSTEAQATVSSLRSSLDHEVAQARISLGDIEHSAGHMKEYSAQFEAASQDSLNLLHRRLESMLDAQTAEMGRRADNLVAGVSQRFQPALDALGEEFVSRTMAELQSRIAPHLERVPELVRELASREGQAEESLRLHRERLRQLSENNQREVGAQIASTLENLHHDFEAARRQSLVKWNEELEAAGVRAAHTATETIGKSADWFQQEARGRLQAVVEQNLSAVSQRFEDQIADAAQKFELLLDGQSAARVASIDQQLQGVAEELVVRARTRFDEAAEAAAASFGQVLHGVSERELSTFTTATRGAFEERAVDFERSTQAILHNLETSARDSVDRFQAQFAAQLESGVEESRGALSSELAAALGTLRDERDAHQREWAAGLDQLSTEAAGKHLERLDTMGDSWVVSSVRRLNEHGQNVIESLMRSADQSLRDSCAMLFDGLSQVLRDRAGSPAAMAKSAPPPGGDQPSPRPEL
jgi:polyhydroxyalkanoate synthesis regulator phasin